MKLVCHPERRKRAMFPRLPQCGDEICNDSFVCHNTKVEQHIHNLLLKKYLQR